jgi:putative ABC transport system permease protein
MHLWEGVVLAMHQIRSEKMKSFFSLLGVIMGVMFLIVVVTIVEGLDQYVRVEVTSQVFGINTVTVRRWGEAGVDNDREAWRARLRSPRLRYEDADAIRERLTVPALIGVESDTGASAVADNGRTATGVLVVGASIEMFTIRDLKVARGRIFSDLEASAGIPVLVLGQETAEVLFEESDPLGRVVRLRGFPYRVIGVLEERGSLFGQSLDNFAMAPARSPIQSITNPRGVIDEIIVQTLDPDQIREAQAELEGIMRTRRQLHPSEPNNFAVETADDAISFWDNISKILFTALPSRDLTRCGWHRDHEHHAGVRDGTHPRDRRQKGAGGTASRYSDPGPHRVGNAVHRRGDLGSSRGDHARHVRGGDFADDCRGQREVDCYRGNPRHVRRDHGRGLPRHAGF